MSSTDKEQKQQNEKNFEDAIQQRIQYLQTKLNKQCANYDALMPILTMPNFLNQLQSNQRQNGIFSKKVQKFHQIMNQNEKKSQKIDRNYWQKQIQQINQSLQKNKNQLSFIMKYYLIKRSQLCSPQHSTPYYSSLHQEYSIFQQQIHQSLAQYKTQIQTHKLLQKHNSTTIQFINQRLEMGLQPFRKECQRVEQDIQVFKLMTPRRDLRSFHQFNFHRLGYQILVLKEILEELNQTLHRQTNITPKQYHITQKQYHITPKQYYITQKEYRIIQQVQNDIQQIKYQIQGSKRKYRTELALIYFQTNKKLGCHSLQKQIHKNVKQLEQSLNQLLINVQKIKSNQYQQDKSNQNQKDKPNKYEQNKVNMYQVKQVNMYQVKQINNYEENKVNE